MKTDDTRFQKKMYQDFETDSSFALAMREGVMRRFVSFGLKCRRRTRQASIHAIARSGQFI